MISKLHEMLSRYQASAPPGSPSRTMAPQGQEVQRVSQPASPMSGAGGFGSLMSRYRMPVRKFASGGYFEEDEDSVPTLEELLAAQQGSQPAAAVADPGASMPIAAAVAPEPQPVSRSAVPSDLQSLLRVYSQPSTYDADIKAARERSAAEQEKFDALIQRAMNEGDKGPSKSEMYFQLAQAFLNPGKTGDFTEGLGAAAGVMSRHKAAEREAQSANAARRSQLGLEAQKLKSQAARDDLTTLRVLSSQDAADNRAIGGKLLEQYIQSGRPQSEAGKQAMDAGFTPGTPEYAAYVQKAVQDKLDSGSWYKEAMISMQLGNLNLRRDEAERQRAKDLRLSPSEIDLVIETQDAISSGQNAAEALNGALAINDKIYGGTLGERAQYALSSQINPNDPRVKNTEMFDNLVTSQALAQMKSIFGGNPTEGERKILLDVQGLGSKSADARKKILERAQEVINARVERLKRREKEIRSGTLRERTTGDE